VAEHTAAAEDQDSHKSTLRNEGSKKQFTVEHGYLKELIPNFGPSVSISDASSTNTGQSAFGIFF
jgi:hypothetical protein